MNVAKQDEMQHTKGRLVEVFFKEEMEKQSNAQAVPKEYG